MAPPAVRSRHVGSAVVLGGMAAFATWNVLHNSNWLEVVVPFGPLYRPDVAAACALGVLWWVGGLALLTGAPLAVWPGRLGAAVLVVLGAWLLADTVANRHEPGIMGDPLLFVVPMTAFLVGAGTGILFALRPRGGRGASA